MQSKLSINNKPWEDSGDSEDSCEEMRGATQLTPGVTETETEN